METKPLFILFKYATKGRPERFFDGLDTIYNNIVDKENFHVLVTAGEDDATMNNDEVINRIAANYPNTTILFGENTGKVTATNRDFDVQGVWSDFDILINMADDQRFTLTGFDNIIRLDMSNFFPELDGLLHYPDQDALDRVPVLYVAGKKYFERRGRLIAWPEYKSLFWDNDDMEYSKLIGKYQYINNRMFDHLCPAYGYLERDIIFNRDQDLWQFDENVFNRRKSENFGLQPHEIVSQ